MTLPSKNTTQELTSHPEIVHKLDEFVSKLSAEPVSGEVKINKFANNAKYMHISAVESKLDYIFHGLWKVTNFEYTVVANEIIGSLQLHVFHPVAGVWIERTGAASTMIQCKSGTSIGIENKIPNTLTKDFPKLKTECIRNAAKSLGRVFGRNLNREFEDGLQDMDFVELALEAIQKVETQADLEEIWKGLPKAAQSDRRVINAFKEQKIRIGK